MFFSSCHNQASKIIASIAAGMSVKFNFEVNGFCKIRLKMAKEALYLHTHRLLKQNLKVNEKLYQMKWQKIC